MSSSIDPLTYRDFTNYIEALKKKLINQEKEIKKAEIEVKNCQKILAEAVKERKMLEKLKENQRLEYNKEQILLEQKQIDEIVSYQYNKRE